MELLNQLPPGERTEEALRTYADQAANDYWSPEKLQDQDVESLALNKLNRDKWHSVVLEYSLGILLCEDPNDVNVIDTEWSFKGKPTSNGILSVGAIDRVRELDDGTVGVDDFKFGVWKGEPNPRYRDGYAMQGHLYKDVYEVNEGRPVTSVRLIYPRGPHVRNIDIAPEKVHETMTSFSATNEELKSYVATARFPAKPGPLCGWCELAQACPAARLVKDNARDNAAKMRSPLELGIPGSRPLDPDLVARGEAQRSEAKADLEWSFAQAREAVTRQIAMSDGSEYRNTGTAHKEGDPNTGGEIMAHTMAPQTAGPTQAQPASVPQFVDDNTAVPATQGAEAVAPPHQTQPQPQPVPPQTTEQQVAPQQQPAVAQPRPEGFVRSATTNDGRLDFGSYAAVNSGAITTYAVYLIKSAGYKVSNVKLDLVARHIGRIVRLVEFRFSGNRNLQMGVASRSLYAVKEAANYLIGDGRSPFGLDANGWRQWSESVQNLALFIMQTTEQVFEDDSIDLDLVDQIAAGFPAHEPQPFAADSAA